MRRRATLFGAGLVVAASLGLAAPAQAQTTFCVGTAATFVVCTDPTGGSVYEDCVYLGTPPCTNVTVPGPTLSCYSPIITTIRCRGF